MASHTPYRIRWGPISTQEAYFSTPSPSQSRLYTPSIKYRQESTLFDAQGGYLPLLSPPIPAPRHETILVVRD